MALYRACYGGFVAAVSVALAVNVNQANKNGITPLYVACEKGHLDVVQVLLTKKEIQINQATNDGRTPINIASDFGHTEIVRLHVLLQQPNIDIQQKDDWGDTPESSASKKGFTEIVTLLQQHGATVQNKQF